MFIDPKYHHEQIVKGNKLHLGICLLTRDNMSAIYDYLESKEAFDIETRAKAVLF